VRPETGLEMGPNQQSQALWDRVQEKFGRGVVIAWGPARGEGDSRPGPRCHLLRDGWCGTLWLDGQGQEQSPEEASITVDVFLRPLGIGQLAQDDWLLKENATLNSQDVEQCRGSLVNSTWAVDLTEIYSPPRRTAACAKKGLRPDSALDLRTGWNFDHRQDRLAAKDLIEAKDPALLVLSPYCSPFSILQNLSKDKQNPEVRAAMMAQARSHLAF